MKLGLLCFFTFFTFLLFSQEYSRVRIWTSNEELHTLNNLGLALDDVNFKNNTYIEGDFSEYQIELVKNNGFQVDVLIEDVVAYYVAQNNTPLSKNAGCDNDNSAFENIVNPSNFHIGTYAGYYTYDEYLQELDEMFAAYPNLISQKAGIPATPVDETIEGRPLYFVKISDNPNTDETEPEVLYTSIHHAREPGSLIQNIYYMWYLLENYGTDPEVTFLVDNTEMYFVPVINPDGYVYNVLNNPNGGGMHRKNRRDVGFQNKGVDLNRNYSYQWGTTGVDLNNTDSDVYPGTGPFSENETQIIKWFIENHDIQFASNAHTHGDLLLFPIGTTVQAIAPDNDYFQNYTDYMAKYNGYVAQKSSGLYPASGDSDDYMYVTEGVFAITPEIGNGFYPPQSEIEGMCKDMLHPNLTTAHLPHRYGVVTDKEEYTVLDNTGYFNYDFLRLGQENGAITVSFEPITGIQSSGPSKTHDIALNTTVEDSFQYVLNTNINQGDEIKFVYVQEYGTWQRRDTIVKIFGQPFIDTQDDLSLDDNWVGSWALTGAEFYSPSSSMTDSPNQNYNNSSNEIILYNNAIDLSDAVSSKISFYAKWNIEADFDYVQFQVSIDGGNTWIAQCGLYTNSGVNNNSIQPVGKPLYDGVQSSWVREEISMSDYLGEQVQVRFVLRSDQFVTEDGFYFDDFTIYIDELGATDNYENISLNIFPNPTQDELTLSVDSYLLNGHIQIFSLDGKLIKEQSFNINSNLQIVDVNELPKGVYILNLTTKEGLAVQERFVKM